MDRGRKENGLEEDRARDMAEHLAAGIKALTQDPDLKENLDSRVVKHLCSGVFPNADSIIDLEKNTK